MDSHKWYQKLLQKYKISYYLWGGGRISKDTICTLSLQSYDRKYLKFIQAKYNTQTFITSLLERTFVWKEILEGYKQEKKADLQKKLSKI